MAYDASLELKASAAVTSTGQGSAIDLKTMAPHARTLVANAVVTAVSGTSPTCALVIQHSSDNSTWEDLAVFDDSSITAVGEFFCPFETKRRYVRIKHTLGGTSPSFTYSAYIGVSYP